VYGPGPAAPLTSTQPVPSPNRAADPAPLSARQLRALIAGAGRELSWGLVAVAREEHGWRALAAEIPDRSIREDALSALRCKRGQTDGAAMFATLPRARNPSLLRLLVAYQIIWDFLDSVSERGAGAGQANGRQLHLALIDALDPSRPLSDYYLHNPWREDGGYLNALVNACRESCAALPCYERVRDLVLEEAGRAQVLAINHDLDPSRRDAMLEAWAHREFPHGHEATWFELSGASSAGLSIFALLALASEPTCGESEIARTRSAYFPWVSSLAAMLDSYVDQADDAAKGEHSYIAHYPTPELAIEHVCLMVRRCLSEVRSLQSGEKHALIVTSMAAMYLSKDSALTPAMRASTNRIRDCGGSLTRILLPILRLWRTAYSQRST
jgi:tetraprenyl-beta-curcumene synthase